MKTVTAVLLMLCGALSMMGSRSDATLVGLRDESKKQWTVCLTNPGDDDVLFEDWVFAEWHPKGPINLGVRFEADDGCSWGVEENFNYLRGFNPHVGRSTLYFHFRNITTLRPNEKRCLSVPYDELIARFRAEIPQGGDPVQGWFVLTVWVDLLEGQPDDSATAVTLKHGKTLTVELRVRGEFSPALDPPGYASTTFDTETPEQVFRRVVQESDQLGPRIEEAMSRQATK